MSCYFKAQAEKKLARLTHQQLLSQERRKNLRRTIAEVSDSDPEIAAKFRKHNRERDGRPSLETDQPFLHEFILKLAAAGGAADDKRRTESVRCCHTLDDLTKALNEQGFKLSRTGLYFRYNAAYFLMLFLTYLLLDCCRVDRRLRKDVAT